MSFMAPHPFERTTAAALRPFLRKCVNVLRGRSFGGLHKGEGGERRNSSARELALIGHAQRRAFVRSKAQQMRADMGLPPDRRLAG